MGNVVCRSDSLEPEFSVEAELQRLARRHHGKTIDKLIRGNDQLAKWEQSFLRLPIESGQLEWDRQIYNDCTRDMRNLIRVECALDVQQVAPCLTVVNGLIIRQTMTRSSVRNDIENPRILIIWEYFDRFGDSSKPINSDYVSNLIRDMAPDVVITTSIDWELTESFLKGDVSLISGVDKETVSQVKSILRPLNEHVHSNEDTLQCFLGTCKRFLVKEVGKMNKNTIATEEESAKIDCCIIEPDRSYFKTLILSYHDSSDFDAATEVSTDVMLSLCWKYLEVSFLKEYFMCQDISLFEDFVRRTDTYFDSDKPISPYSMLGVYDDESKVVIGISGSRAISGQIFHATTFCFNPEKQFLCEIPHSHRVEMYSSKDLSIVEYMVEASPKNIKCGHPDCGYDACIHRRTFVADNTAITISGVHLDETLLLKDENEIYIWIEYGDSLCTSRRTMSASCHQLSITHLLKLMISSGLVEHHISDSNALCLQKGNMVFMFSLKPITPYTFVFPSQNHEQSESNIAQPNWIRDEISWLQNSLKPLKRCLATENNVDLSLFITESGVIDRLESEIRNLKGKFESATPTADLDLYRELDSIHYIFRLLFAVLMHDEQFLLHIGMEQLSNSITGTTDSSTIYGICSGPSLHAGEYDIDQSKSEFCTMENPILRNVVMIDRYLGDKSENVLTELGKLELPRQEAYFWDGEHWRFLRGDFHSSIISCFLSSRIYHDFVQQCIETFIQPEIATPWETLMASGSTETCKIVVGDTVFESCRAIQFHALRESYINGGNISFLNSLRNCQQWSSSGGKSNAYFAKSSDNRYIIKQITTSEKASFIEFAGDYFNHMIVALQNQDSRSPSCLAKILGMFKVSSTTKREFFDFVILENVFRGRTLEEAYDLKGLPRELDRFKLMETHQTVLLDANLQSKIQVDPLFVSSESLDSLAKRIKIDTDFLSNMNVMDYSLLVGIDSKKREIFTGIIDYLRGYTLDKHIESWVKLLRRPGEDPTVISPKQYATRFEKQILAYFTRVPLN